MGCAATAGEESWFDVHDHVNDAAPAPSEAPDAAPAPSEVRDAAPDAAHAPHEVRDAAPDAAPAPSEARDAVFDRDRAPSTAAPVPSGSRLAAGPESVRLRLDIAYDGTDFHGWAAQGGAAGAGLRTVQGTIEDALSTVLRQEAQLTVAGRTDAGVHALSQVAHVDVDRTSLDTRSIGGDPARLVRRLARLLPPDVSVRGCSFASAGFDARFSALRRHYVYRLTTADAGPLPTRSRDTAVWQRKVDLELLRESAEALLGLHDFAAFCRHRPNATTIRDLQAFSWHDVSTDAEPELYEAHVMADAFCWSMVRSLVGACLATAEGRRPREFTGALLDERARSPLVPVAPANGLALAGVDYPDDAELAARADRTRDIRVLPGEEYRAEGKGCPDTNPWFDGVGDG